MLRGEISRPTGPARYAMSGRNHAPTVGLLTPAGSGLELWAPLLPQLDRFFRVVRLDLPAPANADDALAVLDSLGLDRLDRQVLTVLCTSYAGRAVGLSTISVSVGEDQETVESVVEPFLVRSGLVIRTPKGRQATAWAYAHLGFKAPDGSN